MFVYLNTTKEGFLQMLRDYDLQSNPNLRPTQTENVNLEKFDDFNHIVDQVGNTPYHHFAM
jgi:hypothetical protein